LTHCVELLGFDCAKLVVGVVTRLVRPPSLLGVVRRARVATVLAARNGVRMRYLLGFDQDASGAYMWTCIL